MRPKKLHDLFSTKLYQCTLSTIFHCHWQSYAHFVLHNNVWIFPCHLPTIRKQRLVLHVLTSVARSCFRTLKSGVQKFNKYPRAAGVTVTFATRRYPRRRCFRLKLHSPANIKQELPVGWLFKIFPAFSRVARNNEPAYIENSLLSHCLQQNCVIK